MAIEGIPSEMMAVQVVEFGKPYKIHKVPTPSSLKDHEMLIKTAVASLCHTDSMVREGKFPTTKLPCTGSHEGTGKVAAVGSKVQGFKVGDRVMSGLPRNACGQCDSCKRGNDWAQYCGNMETMNGVFSDGCFAEYHIVDSRNTSHCPDSVSFLSAAPLACAGITIYRAIKVAEVKKGGWLGLIGAGGGLGHLGIKFAQAQGINVIAIEGRDEGIEMCKKHGAQHILDARDGKEQVAKQVQDLTNGLGVDATINVSEHKTSAPLACAITRMHGTLVQVAQPDMVEIPFAELMFRDIRVRGTLIAGGEVSQEMLNQAGEHNITVETNVFHGLDDVPKMVDLAHSGKMKGKAVVVVDESQV